MMLKHDIKLFIYEVDYDACRTRIQKVAGVLFAKGMFRWRILWRKQAVALLKGKYPVYVVAKNSQGKFRTVEVEVYTRNGELFIRTKGNKVKFDNLGELPIISRRQRQ